MRTLFLKIFLWFWAVMALVVLAAIATNYVINLQREEQLQEESRGPSRVFAETAAYLYERNSTAGLDDYLAMLERQARTEAYLFDQQGKPLSTRPLPAEVNTLLQQVQRHELPEVARADTRRLRFVHVTSANGSKYTMISKWQPTRGGRNPFLPTTRTLLLQLLAALITVGLLCYWSARYLTRPVVALREATQKLAAGDLSARVQESKSRDELAEMGRDFNQMAGRIESLIQAQQQLLGDISHELRSPLARLNVALGLARRKANPEIAAQHDRIQREADQLNEMIGELLKLTELETGTESLQTETVALDGLLNEIVADADFEARDQHRHVVLSAAANCRLQGNRKLLRSALENVIRNAIRYTAPDTTVEVQLNQQNAHATIEIRDHGPGVPPEMLSNIFRPFYRVADARDRQSGGTGLGLAITERAIRLHRGKVSASNAPGGGLLVSLTLPCLV